MIKKSKNLAWWWFALALVLIFILLQVPAAWLVAKFYKNNQSLHNIQGSIWHGQSDWRRGNLQGSLTWQVRPLDIFLMRLGAEVEIYSGRSRVDGVVGYGFGQRISVRDLNGEITPETLKNFANWQWPTAPIQLKQIQLNFKPQQGFNHVQGEMHWAGGPLVYEYAQRPDRMNIPALQVNLLEENSKLRLDARDQRSQKMLNLVLDAQGMLDVQATQRLLMTSASYQGQAALDSYVLSTRRALWAGGQP